MIVVLMQDVLDHNIRYELYEHRSGPRLIPRKRAKKIIRSCNVLLANKIAVPTTYYDQNQNLGYFENIFRKINTAPRECFSFLVENDIRKEYLEKFINE
jgi:hypothetical protein